MGVRFPPPQPNFMTIEEAFEVANTALDSEEARRIRCEAIRLNPLLYVRPDENGRTYAYTAKIFRPEMI
jgi:hypothetical protein